jgi:nicotinamide mononucleotide transporter
VFSTYQIVEALSAILSIVYSLLLMREKTIGWLFGIIASVLGVVLFFHTKLYAQSLISVYYGAIGVYGWMYWSKAKQRNEHIHKWTPSMHVKVIAAFVILSVGCAWLFDAYTDSKNPYLDSFVTLFGLLASLKEARKILSSWMYWLVINLASAVLYAGESLYVYALMMVVYAAICIPGYLSWLRIYRKHQTTLS